MLGIDLEFHGHRLAICPKARPFVQRMWKLNPKKGKTMVEEARKLLNARFIKEVQYTTWLANVIMVKKYNGK